MPDRKAQERLEDWRAAQRAEASTEDGSVERRRAGASTRRSRWAFEDASRASAGDHGAAPETLEQSMSRALERLHEVSDESAAMNPGSGREAQEESGEQRQKREADEAEIERELA